MAVCANTEIVVQQEWNGWRTATVHMADVQDVHWRQPPGAPRPLIHAYVADNTVDASRAGLGSPDQRSLGRLLVCVLKRHTTAEVYDALSRQADSARAAHAPVNRLAS